MMMTSFLLAFREIRRHLLRTFLTTLGIIIGVSSVVTMITLGNGATAMVSSQVSTLGSNLLTLRPGQAFGRGGGGPTPAPFELEDAEAIKDQIGGVTFVVPQTTTSVIAIYEGQNWSTTVTGSTADYFPASKLEIDGGRSFSDDELFAGKSVCLLGSTVRENLFGEHDPLGREIRLKDISCTIIGTIAKRGQAGFGGDVDDQVVMPIRAVMRRLTGTKNVQMIQVAVDLSFDSDVVSQSLTALMRERRKLQDGNETDFSVFDSKQFSETLQSTTQTMTLFLGAIAAVSLVVGGIGIMNIMLVSVTERTREIGIRLAIGAVQREVLLQFLVEAVVLSSLGGFIGLLLALAATLGVSQILGLPWSFDWQINAVAFLFSTIIGIVFGYFPARRAASLNPIDALRHE